MKRIYAIYDNKAQDFTGMHMYVLMCFRTDQQAARYFADAINDTTSILNKHPKDYDLVCLGHIEDDDLDLSTPFITALPESLPIINGATLLSIQLAEGENNAQA